MARIKFEYDGADKRTYEVDASTGKRVTQVKCCRVWIECDAFTTTCDKCGADYNWNGSRLAPRSQWGEETGESWFDCY
jgi:hypothetical protein